MSEKSNPEIDSPLGRKSVDAAGSPVGAARLDPQKSVLNIPGLLQRFIQQGDAAAWGEIKARIDYTSTCLDYALAPLARITDFGDEVKAQVKGGKKLLFKPNIVSPACIDHITHGEGLGSPACTPWSFIAALMRWFHDRLQISYHSMCLGEAGTGISNQARLAGLACNGGRPIPTEAVIEGKFKDFYGGYGFYFARKYLVEAHPADHSDDPMAGYEESVSASYLPPGRAGGRLVVYDLNRISDLPTKGRDVAVPGGANFQEITLHKVIVGGDPRDPQDRRDYPGCVLINVPRLKIHTQALFTNAIKNLGIGLYPMEAASPNERGNTHWKYSYPYRPTPTIKSEVPHSVWFAEVDDQTGLPARNEKGEYKARKTAGISGTMVDIVKAVQAEGVFSVHVVDALEPINIRHDGFPDSVKVTEGYAFASLDPVALDVLCARYLFKTVAMAEARKLSHKPGADFLQRVPIPKVRGESIVSGEGLDSPLFRNGLFRHAEERGLGRQEYFVLGTDETTNDPLASLEGHFGRVRQGRFEELMTSNLYYCGTKILWDLQATVLNYARANDRLTGSNYYDLLMKTFDEDGDGVIALDEMGWKGSWRPLMRVLANSFQARGEDLLGYLKSAFLPVSQFLKFSNPGWNSQGHDFAADMMLVRACWLAFRMSNAPGENSDPFFPRLSWGKGKWPSLQFARYALAATSLYGFEYPRKVNALSMYGFAFQYADKKWNGGKYTGAGPGGRPEAIKAYVEDTNGGASPIDFTLFVPKGFGGLNGNRLPNVVETEDPARVFTADFRQGAEVW